jgi:hypothetical protein
MNRREGESRWFEVIGVMQCCISFVALTS